MRMRKSWRGILIWDKQGGPNLYETSKPLTSMHLDTIAKMLKFFYCQQAVFEIHDFSSYSWRVLSITRDWSIPHHQLGVFLKGNAYFVVKDGRAFRGSTNTYKTVYIIGEECFKSVRLGESRKDWRRKLVCGFGVGMFYPPHVFSSYLPSLVQVNQPHKKNERDT
ncbi:unnamed protein product [Brassica rapa]|uniref:F-box associated beta-propeller type 1 domain-containing protein n=1 Tax=Brassica campestris TaxID=3711 RepID=A0A8D9DNS5_BRACM|nr:unnamed protein product [Brassica rapa]